MKDYPTRRVVGARRRAAACFIAPTKAGTRGSARLRDLAWLLPPFKADWYPADSETSAARLGAT